MEKFKEGPIRFIPHSKAASHAEVYPLSRCRRKRTKANVHAQGVRSSDQSELGQTSHDVLSPQALVFVLYARESPLDNSKTRGTVRTLPDGHLNACLG